MPFFDCTGKTAIVTATGIGEAIARRFSGAGIVAWQPIIALRVLNRSGEVVQVHPLPSGRGSVIHSKHAAPQPSRNRQGAVLRNDSFPDNSFVTAQCYDASGGRATY